MSPGEPGGWPSIEDLTLRGPSDPDQVRAQLRHELGLPAEPGSPEGPPGYPDVSGLAEGLGL